MLRKHYKRLKSKFSRAKSFADDLNKERGIVRSRVALLLRSAEIKPLFSDLSHFFLKYANILPCPLNLISSHRLGRAIACMSNGLHPSVQIVRCGTSSRFGRGSPPESRRSKRFESARAVPRQDGRVEKSARMLRREVYLCKLNTDRLETLHTAQHCHAF